MSVFDIGKRLSFEGNLCILRYVGAVADTTGTWLGVEWDDPTRGKHSGRHKGHRYFVCKSNSATCASFVRPTRPADKEQSFLSALQRKYGDGDASEALAESKAKPIVISGKVAEEVGFDKIRKQQGQLDELKVVILDGTQVASAYSPGRHKNDGQPSIRDVCPKVVELDLSRNLFSDFSAIVDICSELEHLRVLRLDGNRFWTVSDTPALDGAEEVFKNITELSLAETNMEWTEICHIASKFPSLTTLNLSDNRLPELTTMQPSTLMTTLLTLNLEYNHFTCLADLAPLTALTSLRNLQLKGNRIYGIEVPHQSTPAPVFTPNLQYVDLSYNSVVTWSFVDRLPACFPGLTALRLAHNPIYDNPDLDVPEAVTAAAASSAGSTEGGAGAAPTNEAAYMYVTARIPQLKALNFGAITAADRTDAEMFYLGRVARQLAVVAGDQEAAVLKHHPRWQALCEEYGEPVITRRKEVNPNYLEARLIHVAFLLAESAAQDKKQQQQQRIAQIPRSFDIYAVKGIAGRLFGLAPLALRLIWETGEWDPVAGFDDEVGDDSEDEDANAGVETGQARTEEPEGKRAGRWVKREVELKDGPRQFGYCVDGQEVQIRVEAR